VLSDLCRSSNPPVIVTGISDVVQAFQNNEVWSQMLPEILNLLRLYLTLPVTMQLYSVPETTQTFLRATVSQQRLNHLALLHCHRDQTLDCAEICNSFIAKNKIRQQTISTFPKLLKAVDIMSLSTHYRSRYRNLRFVFT